MTACSYITLRAGKHKGKAQQLNVLQWSKDGQTLSMESGDGTTHGGLRHCNFTVNLGFSTGDLKLTCCERCQRSVVP